MTDIHEIGVQPEYSPVRTHLIFGTGQILVLISIIILSGIVKDIAHNLVFSLPLDRAVFQADMMHCRPYRLSELKFCLCK